MSHKLKPSSQNLYKHSSRNTGKETTKQTIKLCLKWSPGFTPEAPLDERLLVPFVRGQHVGAVVDAQDRHLVGVLEVLQELEEQK